ncbi:MAG TPA: histidinol dehydrogenase [Ilumatobacteraceae bacterium]|jgi:histidinol dehydrogenase|nr:histidinol dehydrogenase [Ilumatobacteraceae bacterium]
MRRQVWNDMNVEARDALMRRGIDDIFDAGLRRSIAELIEDVRDRGDAAVCDALGRFDGIEVPPDGLRVSADEFEQASVSDEVDAAIDDAIVHLRAFNEAQMEQAADWSIESEPGLSVGEKITPITSAGLFTPSGKASYPSVAYQLAVPAVVAGVPSIALVVPPVPGGAGEVDPAVLVVCRKLGIADVFRVNGPAGIAALGFGTDTIPKVRKIVGPGSPAVTIAQVEMQRHGVATMMLLGPTESLVIADDTADPALLAADLLIEAEHGADSTVVLLTDSGALADAVDAELERQLAGLAEVRATAARASLGPNGGCVLVDSLDVAVGIANEFAPEHLQVAVAEAVSDDVVDGLVNAGEILVGQHTPFSAANFVIGCPASLPTSGFAHVSSGITADTFLKRTAIARADAGALARMTPSVLALADHEGFPAHGDALRLRRG